MAEKITGKIQYINERDGKYGKSYNLKIDGEVYFLQGKFPPRGVSEGDVVELEWVYKGNYKIVEKNSLRKVEANVAPPSRTEVKPTTSYDGRQQVISKQAALNTALEFLKFAKENETLPVPRQKNAGYGYLYDLWLEEAAKLYTLNTGEVWELPERDVEEEAPKPKRKPAAKKSPPPADDFEDDGLPDFGGPSEDEWE